RETGSRGRGKDDGDGDDDGCRAPVDVFFAPIGAQDYRMFSQPTVFVVGAGASAEFAMPLGEALKQLVGKRLDFRASPDGELLGDNDLHAMIRRKFGEKAPIYNDAAKEASRLIREHPFDS